MSAGYLSWHGSRSLPVATRRPRCGAQTTFGILSALIGIALLAGGAIAWAHATEADREGFFTSRPTEYRSATAALAWEGAGILKEGTEAQLVDGELRLRVSPRDPLTPIFVGIARPADLATYLAHVSHDQITSVGFRRPTVVGHAGGGSTRAARPGDQPFWLARASGSGTQTLRFEFPGRDWTAVVMNADGTPGLAVVADRATSVPSLRSIAIGGLAGGVLFLAIGLVVAATGDRVPARLPAPPKGARGHG